MMRIVLTGGTWAFCSRPRPSRRYGMRMTQWPDPHGSSRPFEPHRDFKHHQVLALRGEPSARVFGPAIPRGAVCMYRFRAYRRIARLITGVFVSLVLGMCSCTIQERLHAQQRSIKETLLSGVYRAADAPEVLRVLPPRARDASVTPYVPG